jgi:hypothetical protein
MERILNLIVKSFKAETGLQKGPNHAVAAADFKVGDVQTLVSWVVGQRSIEGGYRSFRSTYSPHPRALPGSVSKGAASQVSYLVTDSRLIRLFLKLLYCRAYVATIIRRGIGLTTGFIGSHRVTHNYSVYAHYSSL